ncbi:MAG: hypothetical protein IPL55_20025 [Saprospiraceae bacterium]|jgi:hypothetical protein|nr:hypothetical protein [Saprospiraceae bacterium]
MRHFISFFILIISTFQAYSQTLVTPTDITNFQNGNTQARENDIYHETTNNLYYIGLSSGKVKFLQDTVRTNSTLTGNGFNGSPLGLAQQSASNGQVLSWNGSAWVPVNAADGSETKINNGINTTATGSGTVGSPYNINVADATNAAKGVVQLTGDLAGTATSPLIATDAVTSAKILNGTVANADLANMSALSVKGNATNAAAAPTDITAGTDGHVLRRSGTTLGFGQIATLGILDNAVTYAKMQNTTGLRLLGNPTGSATVPSEITLGTGLSFTGSVLNATSGGTVTNVSGTSPISVVNGTTTPNISITRNNIITGTSSNVATNPLVLDAGATNAVVGGANATLTVNNTAPLWNANQLQGINIANTSPTTGQILMYDGTNWSPTTLPQILLDANRTTSYTPAPAYQTLAYNSAAINVGSNYNTTSGIFTAPATGLYQVLVHNIYSTGTSANNYVRVRIIANGSINIESVVAITPYSGTVYNSANLSTIIGLNSSQTISISVGGELNTMTPEVSTGQHNLKIIRLN